MWARITIFLAVALLAAAAGGLWLGQMLASQAPQGPLHQVAEASLPVTGAHSGGAPIIPEAPQPRVDGTLGIPARSPVAAGAQVPLVSVLEDADPAIALSSDAGEFGADTGGLDNLIATLTGNPAAGATGAHLPPIPTPPPPQAGRPDLPPELAFAVARPAEEAPIPAWQRALRVSLGRCSSQNFFSPAECEQRLRVQYCEPNGGWGRVAECPASMRNIRY